MLVCVVVTHVGLCGRVCLSDRVGLCGRRVGLCGRGSCWSVWSWFVLVCEVVADVGLSGRVGLCGRRVCLCGRGSC